MTTIEYNIEDYINDADSVVKYVCNSTKMWSYYSDLYSCAMVGLVLARDSFDSTLGKSFSSYVKSKVYQAVIEELRKLFPCKKEFLKLKKTIAILENSIGFKLTDYQVASKLGLSLAQYYKVKYKPVDRLIQCKDMSILNTEYSGPDSINSILMQELCCMLAAANKVESDVIREIYINGLDNRQTASVLKVSEHTVSKAHTSAIERFRIILKLPQQKLTRGRRNA